MTGPAYPPAERRKRVNLTVREDVMKEARELGLNTSRAAEAGIEAAIRKEKGRRWKEENRDAIRAHNERVERKGVYLPRPWWAEPDSEDET
jgi:antitoxin CcdA